MKEIFVDRIKKRQAGLQHIVDSFGYASLTKDEKEVLAMSSLVLEIFEAANVPTQLRVEKSDYNSSIFVTKIYGAEEQQFKNMLLEKFKKYD